MSGRVSGRKKLLLFPPMQTYPTSTVAVASGGITAASLAPGALAGQIVSRVQYGTYTFGAGALTATAIILSVNSKAVLIPLGFAAAPAGNPAANQPIIANVPYIELTNATTVTATRLSGLDSGGGNVAGKGSFCVVEPL